MGKLCFQSYQYNVHVIWNLVVDSLFFPKYTLAYASCYYSSSILYIKILQVLRADKLRLLDSNVENEFKKKK